MDDEQEPLLRTSPQSGGGGLSLVFATLCIIDLFGVFPIMALPRPIIECGWLGIPLALIVFGMQVYTAMLLGRCWTMAEKMHPSIVTKSRCPYSSLAEVAFGTHTGKFVEFLLDFTIFGGGVPNLLVASQNLFILGYKTADLEFSYCYWLVILGVLLCPAMWLGSPKDMKWVAVTSVCTVLGVSILTWTCMLTDPAVLAPVQPPRPTWESFAVAFGIIAFQFDVHPMVLTVQMDMKDKNKLGFAIIGGFALTGSLFVISTLIAMTKYGTAVRYNVLQGLPGSGMLYLDLLLVTLQICLSMVVGGCALFQDVEDRIGVPREFGWKRMATRSTIIILTVLIGEVVPRFDLIMGILGGGLMSPLMFVLPPLLYTRFRTLQARTIPNGYSNGIIGNGDTGEHYLMSDRNTGTITAVPWSFKRILIQDMFSMNSSLSEGPLTWSEVAMMSTFIVLGVLATVIATYYSFVDALTYARFTPACIH